MGFSVCKATPRVSITRIGVGWESFLSMAYSHDNLFIVIALSEIDLDCGGDKSWPRVEVLPCYKYDTMANQRAIPHYLRRYRRNPHGKVVKRF